MAISIDFTLVESVKDHVDHVVNSEVAHCDKCEGPCGKLILHQYVSNGTTSRSPSEIENDERLLNARANYTTNHWGEGDLPCNHPNCPYSGPNPPMLQRQRSVAQESHFWFCHMHHLPRMQSMSNSSSNKSNPSLLSRVSSQRYLSLPGMTEDRSLSAIPLLKKTHSVRHQGWLSQQVRKERSDDVLTFGVQFICSKPEAKWKNPKEEVLQNTFLRNKIGASEWNALIKNSRKFTRVKHAKRLRLTVHDIVGLKLYTDFDELQKEFRKCFRTQDLRRQCEFFWWNDLLEKTSRKATDLIVVKLYHGAAGLSLTSTFSGTYYGPVSTTTSYATAAQFSGKKGLILELYPSYNRAGIRLSFLSNYPEEEEVLYMNTSFDVNDILDPHNGASRLKQNMADLKANHEETVSEPCFAQWIELEKTAENAIKKMSITSNILSLNHKLDGCVSGFSDLHCKEKVAMLTLLYLQYYVDDEHAGKDLKLFFKCCGDIAEILSNTRDQFIAIANEITGVKMFYLTPLIEDYLTTDPTKYKWPIQNDHVTADIKAFAKKYKEKQPVKLQTIIRLFPTTEQLILNGDNWDWTLESFVKFLQKWHYDYSHNPLKYIKIKFMKQPGKEYVDALCKLATSKTDFTLNDAAEMDCKWNNKQQHDKGSDEYDDEEATKQLNIHKDEAKENISKILRLGWRFLTPSQLEKVDSFEIPPELPFLLTFMDRAESISAFYRSYTLKLFKSASLPEYDDDAGEDDDDDDDYLIEDEPGSVSKVEVNHNPKFCILTKQTFQKIKYGAQVEEALERRKYDTPVPDKEHGERDSFNNACAKIKVLVLQYKDDPLANRMKDVFYDPNTSNISYQTIYKLFPNVTDIFLKQTEFDKDECDRLVAFLKKEKKCHLERIFYRDNEEKNEMDPDDEDDEKTEKVSLNDDHDEDETKEELEEEDAHTPTPKKMPSESRSEWTPKTLHCINWEFVENSQVAINKRQFI